jgi:phage terminase large subunit GpA-like protein
MPWMRDTILKLMPASWREAAIADSKTWMATCPHCGHVASIWHYGGLRWKASGEPVKGLTCLSCGKFGMQKVRKRP